MLLSWYILGSTIAFLGVVGQKQVLITYPNDTPPADLKTYKAAIEAEVNYQAY